MSLTPAISKFLIVKLPRVLSKGFDYSVRAAKVSPDIIFGRGAETFVNAANSVTRKAGESWLTTLRNVLKTGGKAVEESVKANKAVKGGFLKQAWTSLKTAPKVISDATKEGIKLAAKNNTSKLAGGFKGFFKGVGKRMPLIGNLMLLAFSLPDIISATKDKGIVAGIKETANAGARLAGGALGGALLAPVIPPVGSIIGWCVGEWLTGKIVGKTYGEKKIEEEQKLAEAQMLTVQQLYSEIAQMQNKDSRFNTNTNTINTQNPYAYNPFLKNAYDGDVMMPGSLNITA